MRACFLSRSQTPPGQLELGMLHRPLFPGTRPEETACQPGSREVDLDQESIWISYCPPVLKSDDRRIAWASLHLITDWQLRCRPGSGSRSAQGLRPILTKHGWLIVYHGVSEVRGAGGDHPLCYSAGVMVLSKQHPRLDPLSLG